MASCEKGKEIVHVARFPKSTSSPSSPCTPVVQRNISGIHPVIEDHGVLRSSAGSIRRVYGEKPG